MELNWKKPKGKPPEYEVLAVGYLGQIIVGILKKDDEGWYCEHPDDGGILLEEVRYYIPAKDLRKTVPKE